MSYSYDVFVSYAYAANEKPLESSAQYGWVTMLAYNLNAGQAATASTSSSPISSSLGTQVSNR